MRSSPGAGPPPRTPCRRRWCARGSGRRRARAIDSLGAWVATVALNVSRSGVRRKMAERRAGQRLGAPPTTVPEGRHADTVDVERAVATLPRRQREVVVLRYLLDLNTAETAITPAHQRGNGEERALPCARRAGAATRDREHGGGQRCPTLTSSFGTSFGEPSGRSTSTMSRRRSMSDGRAGHGCARSRASRWPSS